jgi:hypothetical protein
MRQFRVEDHLFHRNSCWPVWIGLRRSPSWSPTSKFSTLDMIWTSCSSLSFIDQMQRSNLIWFWFDLQTLETKQRENLNGWL